MERVAFLVEETGERIRCLLNPENLVLRRTAGVKTRRSSGGLVTGSALADDPLLFTGGGRTEFDLKLLFDIYLAGSSVSAIDARELTSPLWNLAENSVHADPYGRPPLVRFVWGKSWNIPGIVSAVAEKLDAFTSVGIPTRSWLHLHFVRTVEAVSPEQIDEARIEGLRIPEEISLLDDNDQEYEALGQGQEVAIYQCAAGERLDQIAGRHYGYRGHPGLWRLLASYNGISDPMHLPAGLALRLPSLSMLEGK